MAVFGKFVHLHKCCLCTELWSQVLSFGNTVAPTCCWFSCYRFPATRGVDKFDRLHSHILSTAYICYINTVWRLYFAGLNFCELLFENISLKKFRANSR